MAPRVSQRSRAQTERPRKRTCVHAILRGFHLRWNEAAHFALRKLYSCRGLHTGGGASGWGLRRGETVPGVAAATLPPPAGPAVWRGLRGVAVHLRVDADEELAMARVDLGLAKVARQRLDHHLRQLARSSVSQPAGGTIALPAPVRQGPPGAPPRTNLEDCINRWERFVCSSAGTCS
jgi:hypothetical protein